MARTSQIRHHREQEQESRPEQYQQEDEEQQHSNAATATTVDTSASAPSDSSSQSQTAAEMIKADESESTTIDSSPPPLPDFTKIWLQRYNLQKWGYICFITNPNNQISKPKLLEFKEKLTKICITNLSSTLTRFNYTTSTKDTIEAAKTNFEIIYVENENPNSTNDQELRLKHTNLISTTSIPPGQNHSIFLHANPNSISSILSSPLPSEESRFWRQDAPYILAVSSFPPPSPSKEEEEEEEEEDGPTEENRYLRPCFRVAVQVLTDEFWSLIGGDIMPLRRISRCLEKEDEIWWSVHPNPERYERRRRRRAELYERIMRGEVDVVVNKGRVD